MLPAYFDVKKDPSEVAIVINLKEHILKVHTYNYKYISTVDH